MAGNRSRQPTVPRVTIANTAIDDATTIDDTTAVDDGSGPRHSRFLHNVT